MYQPPKLSNLDPLVKKGRESSGASLVPTNKTGIKKILKALKSNELVAILPDQVPKEGSGTYSNFFGIPATGNKLNLSGTTIVTMRDGRIAKEHDFFDMKSMLDQLLNAEGDITLDEYQPVN